MAETKTKATDPFLNTEVIGVEPTPEPGHVPARASDRIARAEGGTFANAAMKRAASLVPEPTVYKSEHLEGEDFALWGCRFQYGKVYDGDFAICEIERQDGERAIAVLGGVTLVPKLKEIERQCRSGEAEYPLLVRLVTVQTPNGKMWDME